MKYKLSEIGEIVAGGTPSTKIPEYWNGDIPWITPKDLANYNKKYIEKGERNISKLGLESSSARLLPVNTVLFTSRAPIGYVAIAKNRVATNQGFKSIICDDSKCNYIYLYYWLKLNTKKIIEKANGSTFLEISGSSMKNVEIELPSLEQQEKIVKILNSIDSKVELNIQINSNLLNVGIELLKNEFNGSSKEVLSNVIKFVKGKKPDEISAEKREKYEKYLTIACLNGHELNYANTDKMIISNNDLLMVMDGASSGDVYYGGYGIVGSTLARVDCFNNQYIPEYIFFIMKHYKELIKGKNTGSAIPHTDKVFVGSLEIPEISLEKQESYKVLLKKIQQNNIENEYLIKIRDALLPKLMNGEIDLDKIEN